MPKLMKEYFFITIAMALSLASCSKALTNEAPIDVSEFSVEQSWTIGADHSMDTLLIPPTSASGLSELAIEAYSICPIQYMTETKHICIQGVLSY